MRGVVAILFMPLCVSRYQPLRRSALWALRAVAAAAVLSVGAWRAPDVQALEFHVQQMRQSMQSRFGEGGVQRLDAWLALLEKSAARSVQGQLQAINDFWNQNAVGGEDQQIFNALCLGASGAIAASAHVQTERFVALWQQVRDNQLTEARATFFQLLPLINTLFIEPNPAPVKAALALEGLIDSELRAPMQRATEAVIAKLQRLSRQAQ